MSLETWRNVLEKTSNAFITAKQEVGIFVIIFRRGDNPVDILSTLDFTSNHHFTNKSFIIRVIPETNSTFVDSSRPFPSLCGSGFNSAW